MTRDDWEQATRALYEEAWRADPYHVEEITHALFGSDVFVWPRLRMPQLHALRRALLPTVLEARG